MIEEITLAATVAVAVFGWWFTLWREREKRLIEESIARVDSQIQKLWGPLFAGSVANQSAWEALQKRWESQFGETLEDDSDYLGNAEKRQLWMNFNKCVFQPANQAMALAVMKNVHLFERDYSIPGDIEWFLGHVEAWRAVVSRWSEQDFSAEKAQWFDFESTSAWNEDFYNFVQKNYYQCVENKRSLLDENDSWRFLKLSKR